MIGKMVEHNILKQERVYPNGTNTPNFYCIEAFSISQNKVKI